jgi:hypothetical protein
MVRVGGARQRFRSALAEAQLNREPFRAHLGKAQRRSSFPRDHDEIDSVREEGGPLAETFSAEPFDAVSMHRAPDLACDHHPKSRSPRRRRLRGDQQREVSRPDAAALTLLARELRVPAQPALAPELERHYFL